MDLEKTIEKAIRRFDFDRGDVVDSDGRVAADESADWPAALASDIVKAILVTNLRRDSPYEESHP